MTLPEIQAMVTVSRMMKTQLSSLPALLTGYRSPYPTWQTDKWNYIYLSG